MSRCPSCSAYPGSDHHPECAFMKKRGMSEINRLRAENEALRADNQNLRRSVKKQVEAEFTARAEVEVLNERLHKIAASVNSLPTCKVAVDGVLWIPADRYNALIDALRGEGE